MGYPDHITRGSIEKQCGKTARTRGWGDHDVVHISVNIQQWLPARDLLKMSPVTLPSGMREGYSWPHPSLGSGEKIAGGEGIIILSCEATGKLPLLR